MVQVKVIIRVRVGILVMVGVTVVILKILDNFFKKFHT